ncbi:disease resistance protein RPM1-like [Cornus florida]|uniref:disease resistance protein RPM1-like n=1 Tax=Cornus florida TaxID=4283 RepID=UPI00289FB199|nr:disease resistance protein RPM1-like [Cornus florida]
MQYSAFINDKLENMKKILPLSYYNLPYYLKICFLYLGIFPEDYKIERMRLIRLWIAEGFVEVRGEMTMEEVAESYLNELINRSLVQVAKIDDVGRRRECRLHDLFHFKVKKTKCCRNMAKPISKSLMPILFNGGVRLLKVLDLRSASLETLPDEIVKLFHLRYLSLRGTNIKMLSKSISKLENLETLDLKGTYVTELPIQILKLQQLRHLLVYRCGKVYPIYDLYGFRAIPGIEGFSSLQKLCFIEVNHGNGRIVVGELGRLTRLKRLGITKLRREDGIALCSSLEKLSNLLALSVRSVEEDEIIDIQHLSSPPRFLQQLYLKGRLEMLPLWISLTH